MVGTGRTLYVDAIDNKAPLVYVIVAIVDKLPGDLITVRAIAVGGFLGGLAWVSQRTSEQRGMPRKSAAYIALICTGLAALVTGLTLTTELPAIVVLIGSTLALCRAKPGIAILLALCACGLDPRSIFLVPGILLFAAKDCAIANTRRGGGSASSLGYSWLLA
jgi:hypothetical protein